MQHLSVTFRPDARVRAGESESSQAGPCDGVPLPYVWHLAGDRAPGAHVLVRVSCRAPSLPAARRDSALREAGEVNLGKLRRASGARPQERALTRTGAAHDAAGGPPPTPPQRGVFARVCPFCSKRFPMKESSADVRWCAMMPSDIQHQALTVGFGCPVAASVSRQGPAESPDLASRIDRAIGGIARGSASRATHSTSTWVSTRSKSTPLTVPAVCARRLGSARSKRS